MQNNMRELYGLLNLLNPVQFSSEEDFIDQFGDEKSMTFEQVRAGFWPLLGGRQLGHIVPLSPCFAGG